MPSCILIGDPISYEQWTYIEAEINFRKMKNTISMLSDSTIIIPKAMIKWKLMFCGNIITLPSSGDKWFDFKLSCWPRFDITLYTNNETWTEPKVGRWRKLVVNKILPNRPNRIFLITFQLWVHTYCEQITNNLN